MLLAGRTHCLRGFTGYHGSTRPAQVAAGCLFYDLSPLDSEKVCQSIFGLGTGGLRGWHLCQTGTGAVLSYGKCLPSNKKIPARGQVSKVPMLHRETYMHNEIKAEWLTSTEARTFLKISSCTLAHLRLDGRLTFERKRNAFFYSATDCRIVQAKTAAIHTKK